MPNFEVTKSIEARKLNPRSKLPTNDPPVTIPYGAILANVVQERDLARFTHLGGLYQCDYENFMGAVRSLDPDDKERPATSPSTKSPASPMVESPKAGIQWEKLDSGAFALYRAKVSGGWLIATGTPANPSLTFMPDPGHEWDGRSLS